VNLSLLDSVSNETEDEIDERVHRVVVFFRPEAKKLRQ
jgi:hypothetical protein